MDKGESCPICYEPMNAKYVKMPYCGHRFHIKCMKTWNMYNMFNLLCTCPVCRHEYDNVEFNLCGNYDRRRH